MVTSTEVRGTDPHGRLRIVELDEPVPVTEPRLREWSRGFEVPTIVRNAFTPPSLEAATFFEPERILYADVGRVGEFRDYNGEFPWSRIWSAIEQGEDVYGSFGTGTPNLDEATVAVIRRLKARILPPEVFADHQNPGHVIFGATSRLQTTTGWHNAIDANLLFQLHGTKHWYTIEQLPPELRPVAISNFTYIVEREGAGRAIDRDEDERVLNERSAHAVIRPGDMLINTPYSWHAVQIDGPSLSLSLRGDRADVMAWLAFRYFGGHIDHPMLASFGSLFDTVTYGASKRERGGVDLPGVRQALRRRLAIARARLKRRLGLDDAFNPIIDGYAASDSSFQDLRRRYRERFEKYAAASA